MNAKEIETVIRDHSSVYPRPARWLGDSPHMEEQCECGDWIRAYSHERHVAEAIAKMTQPAVTDDMVKSLAQWAAELHKDNPDSFDAFHWAKSALGEVLKTGA